MGTKNNPGDYDCYAAADPDEPMFILLARDRSAPMLVTLWAAMREHDPDDAAQVAEARKCAQSMREWWLVNWKLAPPDRRLENAVAGLRDLGFAYCAAHCDGDDHDDECTRARKALAESSDQT